MKIKMNKLPFTILILGLFLFIAGCPGDSSSNPNDPAKTENSAADQTPPAAGEGAEATDAGGRQKRGFAASGENLALCENVTEQDLRNETRRFPNTLTRQFDEGNIKLSFAGKKLVLKGYIYGNGNNLRALLNGFDRFRSGRCVSTVSFEGSDTTNFEWRPNPDSNLPSMPAGCKTEIDEIFDKSPIRDQINKNFYYKFFEQTGTLVFSGSLHDFTGRGKFTSTVAQLQRLMNSGCIRKIEFTGEIVKNFRALVAPGFEWTVCEAGQCECSGVCVPCPCS